MPQQLECDAFDLLDEAYALSLTVRLDLAKAKKLLHSLRECAEQAYHSGQPDVQQQLLAAASQLQRRLAGTIGELGA